MSTSERIPLGKGHFCLIQNTIGCLWYKMKKEKSVEWGLWLRPSENLRRIEGGMLPK